MADSLLMGVDIGQKREPTAICVAELEARKTEQCIVNHFLVRHLDRLSPGTSYPEVARRLSDIGEGIRQKTDQWPIIYVDATGLGQPVINLLRREVSGFGSIVPVYFNHGDQRSREDGYIRLGKAFLVSRLQVLLQTGGLHLPRTAESERLAQELLDYEIKVDEQANERYGAFRVGTHDDLVTAVGLAVHVDPLLWFLARFN